MEPDQEMDFNIPPPTISASAAHAHAWNNSELEFTNQHQEPEPLQREILISGKHFETLILNNLGEENFEEENNACNELDPELENVQQNYILDDRLPAEMNLQSAEMNELIKNNKNNFDAYNSEDPPYEDEEDEDLMNMNQELEEYNDNNEADYYQEDAQYYEDEEEPFEDIDSPHLRSQNLRFILTLPPTLPSMKNHSL